MALYQKPLQSGARLLELISEQKISPEQLTPHQRRLITRCMLHDKKWTQTEIAETLQVHRITISRYVAKIREQDSWMLDDIDVRKIAIGMIQDAEFASTRLFRSEKYKEAWTVKKELVELLQNLGYVRSEPAQINGFVALQEIFKLAASNKPTKSDEVQQLRATQFE